MLSRHFLRAKVLQAIYASQANPIDIVDVEKNFIHNIQRLNHLGTLQLAALVHLAEVAGVMIDEAQHKFLPTEEDRNPNLRLPRNQFILRLADNYDLRRQCEDAHINWTGVEYDEIFRKAYMELSSTPLYKNYLKSEENFANDQEFALKLFKFVINYEPLRDNIYPKSLLWEDDFDQIAQYNYMMIKALDDTLDEATVISLMHDSRYDGDAEAYDFARRLLLTTLRHSNEAEDMIRKHLKGWDFERIADMDILLLNMAIAELTDFPSIPERVTIDEYIELSKEFSSDRSKLFINGILNKLLTELRAKGRINKSGRGLYDPELKDNE